MNFRIPTPSSTEFFAVAPGRVDARQDQTDIEMFELLEPIADGFRNYRARLDVSTTESLLIDKAQQLTLTAPFFLKPNLYLCSTFTVAKR